jgi:hypothetical protein
MEIPRSLEEGKPRSTEDFQALEYLDDQAIVASLDGAILASQMFYVINQGNFSVVGISLDGVREIARQYADKMGLSFRFGDMNVQETEDAYLVRVKVEVDFPKGGHVENWGVKRQEKALQLQSGVVRQDPYAFEKACSKAQRNALMGVIPKSFIEMAYSEWLSKHGGNVPVVEIPKSRPTTPASPPFTKATRRESPPNGNPIVLLNQRMREAKTVALKSGVSEEEFRNYWRRQTGLTSFSELTPEQAEELLRVTPWEDHEALLGLFKKGNPRAEEKPQSEENEPKQAEPVLESVFSLEPQPQSKPEPEQQQISLGKDKGEEEEDEDEEEEETVLEVKEEASRWCTNEKDGTLWLTWEGYRECLEATDPVPLCTELKDVLLRQRTTPGYLIKLNSRIDSSTQAGQLNAVALCKRPSEKRETLLSLASLMSAPEVWARAEVKATFRRALE